MDNEKIKEVLKHSAYVLISSYTARKAFLEALRDLDARMKEDGHDGEDLTAYLPEEAKRVRDNEIKKLQERLETYA